MAHDDSPTQNHTSTPAPESNPANPPSSSLARSSTIMFLGTLTSRALGFVRNGLLIAAIGGVLANDAFSAANTLPNTIFNLLAGGVLNAILVPQIVRALQKRSGTDYVNRLLTMAGTLLLAATVITTAAATLLVSLFAAKMVPEWKALAVAFAFWCLPQIFFYGIYSLYGQVLNAQGSFGPYMWSPVLNNIVGIAGIIALMVVFGTTAGADIAWWTNEKIALLAGTSTLGVAVQAIVLIIPLKRMGFQLKLRFDWRGAGLGSASKVASWAFAGLAISQLGFLAVQNVAAAATQYAVAQGTVIAATAAYANAFMLHMLPQSLVTTSLVTALFTQMSRHAAQEDNQKVAQDYSFGMRIVGVFTVFAGIVSVVLAHPLVQLAAPTAPLAVTLAYAKVLAVMSLGVAFQGTWTVLQRVFYAYEDTRTLFFMQIPVSICSVSIAGLALLFPPEYWVVIAAAGGDFFSLILGTVIAAVVLHRRLPEVNNRAIVGKYAVLFLAGMVSGAVGAGLLYLVGWDSGGAGITWQFLGALWRILVIGSIMAIVYVALLWLMRVPELGQIARPVSRLLSRLFRFRKADKLDANSAPSSDDSADGAVEDIAGDVDDAAVEDLAGDVDTIDATSPLVTATPSNNNHGPRLFNPTKITLSVAAALVVVSAIYGSYTLFKPPTRQAPGATAQPSVTASPKPSATAQTTAPPVNTEPIAIAQVLALDPEGDNNEHPELQDRAFDQDPTTYWFSRYYLRADYGMKSGVGLAINFAKEETVQSITLLSGGTGGKIEVRATTADQPLTGPVLAHGEFGREVTLQLDKPTTTSSLVLWFPALPTSDSDGKFKIEVAELQVK